jgi:hypothetical protein
MSSIGKIENMAQLRREMQRLEAVKSHQEDLLRQDLKEVKKSLHPKRLIAEFLGIFTTGNENNPDLLRNGLTLGLNFLSDRLLFGKAPSSIIKYLLTQFVQKTAANAISGQPDTIVDKIKSMLTFILAKGKKGTEPATEEQREYDENEPYGV